MLDPNHGKSTNVFKRVKNALKKDEIHENP